MDTVLIWLSPVGTGENDDARRVDLPTYRLVQEEPASGVWLVSVPVADVTADVLARLANQASVPPGTPTERLITASERRAWDKLLTERYGQAHEASRP